VCECWCEVLWVGYTRGVGLVVVVVDYRIGDIWGDGVFFGVGDVDGVLQDKWGGA
jgi:hypothetical protein